VAQNIGLFGGTFDPIHNGHLALAGGFASRLSFHKIFLMPAAVPPHKQRPDMAPAEHRLRMCELAVEGRPPFEVSSLEIDRGGASYTADTLGELKKEFPRANIYLIMGADMYMTVQGWRRFGDIARLATLCTAPRGDISMTALRRQAAALEQIPGDGGTVRAASWILGIPLTPVSSTEIRRRIKAGEPIGGMVPEKVADYIHEKELYL